MPNSGLTGDQILQKLFDAESNTIGTTAQIVDPTNWKARFVFNEVMAIPVGVETTIIMYTVPTATAYLQCIQTSGQNLGNLIVYKNLDIIDKAYYYYTHFNINLDYRTFVSSSGGVPLISGDVVWVKVLNNGQDACSFNARLQVVEEN